MSTAVPPGACDYCGLPVFDAAVEAGAPCYCCYGCRFAASVMRAEGGAATSETGAAMSALGLSLFFTMNVMAFTFFLWSERPAVDSGQARVLYDLARYICLLLTSPVLLLLGRPLLEDAMGELRRGRASINLLLMIGVLSAFAYSAWNVFTGTGHVYFEVSCMVLVAVSLGRWFEASGKLKTTSALRQLQKLLPDKARRVSAAGEETVPLQTVAIGDILRFTPGDVIAIDGSIERGEAAIDECMITGESTPVLKSVGAVVFSGTTNVDGELYVRATSNAGAGTIERLIEAVLGAVQGRTRLERLAEHISRVFLPTVLIIALATFVWHWMFADLAAAMLNALAVVVIACPCALGLATPMALWAAIGQATRRHLLVRDGDAFGRLGNVTVFCFDKTGTLTVGCEVSKIQVLPGFREDRVLSVAAALARTSQHPASQAITRHAIELDVAPMGVSSTRSIAGCGIRGQSVGTDEAALLGSEKWLLSTGIDTSLAWAPGLVCDESRALLAIDGQLGAVFILAQRHRPLVKEALIALRAAGARTLILSGDEAARAKVIGNALGCEIEAPLLPAEKLEAIRLLQQRGEVVAMVGDGLNDAPALAAADVGIALGCGADISRWAGSICLLSNEIAALPWLVNLSRRTTRTIRWNLLWTFGYNAVCIPLAAAGQLHPAIAAGAMVLSSLLVVANSLRLATDETSEDSEPVRAAPPPHRLELMEAAT